MGGKLEGEKGWGSLFQKLKAFSCPRKLFPSTLSPSPNNSAYSTKEDCVCFYFCLFESVPL